MVFAHAGDPKLSEYFDSFFKDHRSNVWVRALADLDKPVATWFDESVELEAAKPLPDEHTVEELTSQALSRDWEALSFEWGEISIEEFESAQARFEQEPTLEIASALAGFSWDRNHEQSSIGFDPELTLLRFRLACWIVRNVPGSKLGFSHFFMEPFMDPIPGTIFPEVRCNALIGPVRVLADLWIQQLRRFPEDKILAKNAARFSARIHMLLPEEDRMLREQLRKTEIGKRAIKNRFR